MQITTDLDALYADHLATLRQRLDKALAAVDKRGLLVPSGTPHMAFLDDHPYPFVVNPHFKAWVPLTNVPDSYLLLRQGETPVLFYNQPEDYWHKPPADPTGAWTEHWDIHTVRSPGDVHNLLGDPAELAFIGEETALASDWGIDTVNDERLLSALHYGRAYKTPYELAALQLANLSASRGHLAAKAAFDRGESEFAIQHAYLGAIAAREQQMPYSNIVALNENCAVLHYQHYELNAPDEVRSMLIDAGANVHGYAADVTRTWARPGSEFADLVARMDTEQQAIIEQIVPGMNYADLHRQMHLRVAHVLKDFDLVDMAPASMVETNLTFTFLPHGLGHLLGLQTHDVGGFQQDASGTTAPPPDEYPALRLTRSIEEAQVFTIEPGLYFIPMLLRELKASAHAGQVNWTKIEALAPFGGIRIEDNIAIIDGKPVNMTREAFAAVDHD